ncbi:MAG: hypothetical protein FWH01_07630 [Oscillospiraceae bacterium]|nr:hypothetical protein [Oscillospiraceae bacterium]
MRETTRVETVSVKASVMESAREYSERIIDSSPATRVSDAIEAVRDAMEVRRSSYSDVGSVLNDETRGLPMLIRKAMSERQKLERVPPGIWDGQIFAGCHTYNSGTLANDHALPEFALPEEIEEGARYGHGIYSMFGHISPDYPRILRMGTTALAKTVKERLATAEGDEQVTFLKAALISIEGLESYAKRHVQYLRDLAEQCTTGDGDGDDDDSDGGSGGSGDSIGSGIGSGGDSIISGGSSVGDGDRIGGSSGARRRRELLEAADICERVPMQPARTFREACQSAWFVHVALQLTGNHLALGRPDQYLNPYLEADLSSGRLTIDQAQEIMDLWMLKFNERAFSSQTKSELRDWQVVQENYERRWRERTIHDHGQQRYNVRDDMDATIHYNQNIVIGGCKRDGSDAVNLASVMILESSRRLRMTNPVMSARVNEHTPDWFFRQLARALKTGGGMPAIYSDKPILNAYTSYGVSLEDARDFANNGCWECILPGRTDFYFQKINGLKCLEWTLNRGRCHIDDKQEVPDLGDPSDFGSFDVLLDKCLHNVAYVADEMSAHMAWMHPHRSSIAPTPLLSVLLDGPVEKGRDMTDMSTRFIVNGLIFEGMSHLIDSLAAIRQLVFREGRYSMAEIVDAIDHDFDGYEHIQSAMLDCPKYGTNNAQADDIGREIVKRYSDIVRRISDKYDDMMFMPGIGTFSWYIAVGEGTGASADGRNAAMPIASNFSPSAGAMLKGVTAAIRSFSSMGIDTIPIGSPLDLGLSGNVVDGEEGVNRLVGLLKSFRDLGGNLMTITIVDTETLRAARENPSAYRDLRVRMGGWSAYFTMLSPEQQEHHIRKSESGFM